MSQHPLANNSLPFTNNYQLKTVAENNSKACYICFKPTVNVLLSENKCDFFYICYHHLLDESFANSVKPKEYTDLFNKVKDLNVRKNQLDQRIIDEKPYIWSKVSSYWSKEKESKEEKNEGKSSKYESLKTELANVSKDLDEAKEKLNNYKFKTYTLHQDIYKSRLKLKQKKKHSKERTEKIQQEGFFPSAPTHSIN